MKILGNILLSIVVLILTGCFSSEPIIEESKPVPYDEFKHIKEEMERKGFEWGTNAYVRIFKKESVLEVWLKRDDGSYGFFRDFPICIYSGELGPKRKQGDKQAPEGFYEVGLKALNPNSQYHLSFNLGYPNAYDSAHGYTGNYLMVHGECVSVGCYAMGNAQIEEIYTLVASALQHGQSFVPVHIFPFKMTKTNMLAYQSHRWMPFWQQLKPAYDYFEQHRYPPIIETVGKRYNVKEIETIAKR